MPIKIISYENLDGSIMTQELIDGVPIDVLVKMERTSITKKKKFKGYILIYIIQL